MKIVLPPLISILGFALYMLVTVQFAIYRRLPFEYLGLSAVGAGLGILWAYRQPALGSVLSALIATGILGFSSYYYFSLSMFPAREVSPRVGDAFPDFTLATSSGEPFHLGSAKARHLIVLYRGDW